MQEVYNSCPIIEDEIYRVRLLEEKDTCDLLEVYSDPKAVRYFNKDNCHGEDFYYTDSEQMKKAVDYWLYEYGGGGFVRFAIEDKKKEKVIGTVEAFKRESKDYYNGCCLLRIDVGSKSEKREVLEQILLLVTRPMFALFECSKIVTKAEPFAIERSIALKNACYVENEHMIIGEDGTKYSHYWVCER